MNRKKLSQRAVLFWLILCVVSCSLLYAEQIRRQYWERDREFHRIFSSISAVLTQNESVLPLLNGDEEIVALRKKFPLILTLEKTVDRARDSARVEPSGPSQYWLYNPWRQIRVKVDLTPLVPEHNNFTALVIQFEKTFTPAKTNAFWHWQETFPQSTQPFTLVAEAKPHWLAVSWLPHLLIILLWAVVTWGASVLIWQRQQRQNAERRARYYQHARLNTLGEITAGIVHEINQPLTAAQTWIQGAKRQLAQERHPQVVHALSSALIQTQRIGELLQRFREHVVRDNVELRAVDLAECWEHVGNLLAQERMADAVQLRHDFAPDGRVVMADRLWLEQVLHNLLSNAIQAQQETKKAWVGIQSRRHGEEIVIVIRDGGPGFSDEALQNAYMPFYSGRQSGMGLGMTLTESLMGQMNGTIFLANAPQGGAEVTLHLPRSEECTHG